ncbi:MAG: hypothetical protein OXU73_02160 [Candidatus Campbellbacteria bacterium]|nr:hypothetical protein [Candidatus Campbellbacteria bacterium]
MHIDQTTEMVQVPKERIYTLTRNSINYLELRVNAANVKKGGWRYFRFVEAKKAVNRARNLLIEEKFDEAYSEVQEGIMNMMEVDRTEAA